MANIREVAEKANVAKCTVSRVLNGSDKVSEKTKTKVMNAIKELDYTPNELARGMFKQRSGIIAMIVPSIRHPFFSSLASYFEVELYKRGYKLMFCSAKGSYKRELDYLNIFKTNIVDGIIFGVSNLEKSFYEEFKKPMIMLDKYINEDIPVVVSNHKQGGALAAETFIGCGCKHVIHICDVGSKDVLSYQSHLELNRLLEEHNIAVETIEIQWNSFDFNAYYEFAKKVLDKDITIDGVMAADMPAAAFLKAAYHLDKKVPEDLSIIAYDGTYVSRMNTIELTTIVQPLSEIAEVATSLLFKQIDEQKIESNRVEINVSIKKGETTK